MSLACLRSVPFRNRSGARAARLAQNAMKQRITRELFDYCNTLRGQRPAPDRNDIDPGAIRACLLHTFVLAFDPDRGHPFRIAGTEICNLFGRELTGTPFATLWAQDSRRALADIVRTIADETAGTADGAVASVTGRNVDGDTLELEVILLPLPPTAAPAGGCSAPLPSSPPPIGWACVRFGRCMPARCGESAQNMAKKFAAGRNLLAPGFVIYRGDEEQRISRKNQG